MEIPKHLSAAGRQGVPIRYFLENQEKFTLAQILIKIYKKNMNLFIKTILIIFVIGICCFPCKVESNEGIVLRMIGPEDIGGAWHDIIKRFEAKNPDIRIKFISGPWSTGRREDMYIRSFMGGDPIELVYMDVIWTAYLASKGWIIPLDKWITPELMDKFLPGDIKAGFYKGRLYRIPVRSDAGVLYYRKDLVKKPPETWEEFESICEKLKSSEKPLSCIIFQGSQYEGLVCNFLEFLWGAGGNVLSRRGDVVLDREATVDTLYFMRNLIKNGLVTKNVLSYQEQHSLHAFAQGKGVFLRNWPYAWNILNSTGSRVKGRVGIAPMIHRKGERPAATLGGWGLGIASGCKNPGAAWKFIKFVTGEEAQKILHFRRGAVPSLKKLFFDPEIIKDSPHYPELYRILLNARPRPVHPKYSIISNIIQVHVSAVLSGIETPEEAAKEMGNSIKSVVKSEKIGLFFRLIIDSDLHRILLNTAYFTIFSVPFEFLLGFAIALFLHPVFRGRGMIRSMVILPWTLPTAVMAMSWQWIFSDPFGIMNDILIRIGIINAPVAWLSTPGGAMFAAVFADIWKTTPFVVIIILAGLQSIPRELFESIAIDGRGSLDRLRYLIIPLLLPYIGVALVFRIIHAAGIFDLIWVLTHGGPADRTRTLTLYIYDLAFRYDEMEYAVLLTVIFAGLLMIISYLITYLSRLPHEKALQL